MREGNYEKGRNSKVPPRQIETVLPRESIILITNLPTRAIACTLCAYLKKKGTEKSLWRRQRFNGIILTLTWHIVKPGFHCKRFLKRLRRGFIFSCNSKEHESRRKICAFFISHACAQSSTMLLQFFIMRCVPTSCKNSSAYRREQCESFVLVSNICRR